MNNDPNLLNHNADDKEKETSIDYAAMLKEFYANQPLTLKDRILGIGLFSLGIIAIISLISVIIYLGYTGKLITTGTESILEVLIFLAIVIFAAILIGIAWPYCMKINAHNPRDLKRWKRMLKKDGKI